MLLLSKPIVLKGVIYWMRLHSLKKIRSRLTPIICAALVPTANVIPASWKSMVFETDDFPVPIAMVEDGPTSGSEKQASPSKLTDFIMKSLSLKV